VANGPEETNGCLDRRCIDNELGALRVLAVDDRGTLRSSPLELRGSSRLLAATGGDGQGMGLVTERGGVWLTSTASVALDARPFELRKAEVLVPVRGDGPPTFLTSDDRGRDVVVVDPTGARSAEGSLIPFGSLFDARLQARWGEGRAPQGEMVNQEHAPQARPPARRVHVAHHAWQHAKDATQASVLESGALRVVGPPERSITAPFEDYVTMSLRGRELVRTSWLQESVGEPFDPSSLVPTARLDSVVVEFTGRSFVVTLTDAGEGLHLAALDCLTGAP
jgi:hypothetical protein